RVRRLAPAEPLASQILLTSASRAKAPLAPSKRFRGCRSSVNLSGLAPIRSLSPVVAACVRRRPPDSTPRAARCATFSTPDVDRGSQIQRHRQCRRTPRLYWLGHAEPTL